METQLTEPREDERKRGAAWRILATGGLLAATAGLFGSGLNATFTSTVSQNHTVGSGTVEIALGDPGPENRLTINADNIAAGDTIERAFDLKNIGSLDLSTVRLTTVADTSSKLDTDTTDGLQMRIDRCSQPWTEAGSSPAFTYTCGGVVTSVIPSGPVIGTDQDLSGLASTSSGATDNLRLLLELPQDADNSFQGLTSVIRYDFTGTQRAATSR